MRCAEVTMIFVVMPATVKIDVRIGVINPKDVMRRRKLPMDRKSWRLGTG